MAPDRAPEHPSFYVTDDGVRLAYDTAGEGPSVLLLHGFASDARTNWIRPGVRGRLVDAGMRVVTYDARGHGRSDKPHDPAAYGEHAMVRDAQGLIDRLQLAPVDVVGYSMGAHTASMLVPGNESVRRCVLGGIGSSLLLDGAAGARYPAAAIAEALETPDPSSIPHATGKAFRAFADATKADRLALAALQRGRVLSQYPRLGAIGVPTLVVVGDRDTLIGDAGAVAGAIPGAQLVVVPGDHLSAVVSPDFADALVAFLTTP